MEDAFFMREAEAAVQMQQSEWQRAVSSCERMSWKEPLLLLSGRQLPAFSAFLILVC